MVSTLTIEIGPYSLVPVPCQLVACRARHSINEIWPPATGGKPVPTIFRNVLPPPGG